MLQRDFNVLIYMCRIFFGEYHTLNKALEAQGQHGYQRGIKNICTVQVNK